MDRIVQRAIVDKFLAEIRSFFDELIGGTDKYKQLYSLSEQIPHDYHNRFLVELIQNANDASTADGAVQIILDETRDGTPCLYVANKGCPFTPSNFERICKLGLSDKDPAEAIGNKGLGFRSVLQICDKPRIYSDHEKQEYRQRGQFGGFCFEFDPAVRTRIVELAQELQSQGTYDMPSPLLRQHFHIHEPLLAEPSRARRLSQLLNETPRLIDEEVEYLSPYSLPLAVPMAPEDPILLDLLEDGFVTVVQLELGKSGALESVRQALEDLDCTYLLFTEKLVSLSVEHRTPSNTSRNFTRICQKETVATRDAQKASPPFKTVLLVDCIPAPGGHSVTSHHTERMWWVHQGEVTGKELTDAVKELPRLWHNLTRASVSIALEQTQAAPPEGVYSIYLPTKRRTGSALWLNGPFSGNVARTEISLGIRYNQLLFQKGVELAIEMLDVLKDLQTIEGSQACLDLLDEKTEKSPLIQAIDEKLATRKTPLKTLQVVALEPRVTGAQIYCAASLGDVRQLPEFQPLRSVFTLARLAAAGAPIPAARLITTRSEVLQRIAKRAGNDFVPSAADVAAWVENIASALLHDQVNDATWNVFYAELAALSRKIDDLQATLRNRKFLLTEDRRLLAPAGEVRLFALPERTTAGAKGGDPRSAIPRKIQSRMAFFSSRITLAEAVRQFLRAGSPPLVQDFTSQSIVNNVLVPMVERRAKLQQDKDRLMFGQVLLYAFHLSQNTIESSQSAGINWARLLVPTNVGWQPAHEAYFSEYWEGTQGAVLRTAFPDDSSAVQNWIVPPEDFWKAIAPRQHNTISLSDWVKFLRDQLKVSDTPKLRELAHRRDQPMSELRMSGSGAAYNTNELTNALGMPDEIWKQYITYLRESLNPPIKKYEIYFLERQATLDGLYELTVARAAAYAALVASSLDTWKRATMTGVARVSEGYQPDGRADSTLGYALKHLAWLPAVHDGAADTLARPADVWFVPAAYLETHVSRRRYSFLRHVHPDVARSPHALDFCKSIGVRSATEIESLEHGIALLGALVAAQQEQAVPPERDREFGDLWRDTLVRTARFFHPQLATLAPLWAQKYGFRGVRAYLAGKPRWVEFRGTASSIDQRIYLPDERRLEIALGGQLQVADLRDERLESQMALLKAFFGDHVASLSTLGVIPESPGCQVADLVAGAPRLGTYAPWLEVFILAVYAFGRLQDMNLRGEIFTNNARRFRQLRFVKLAASQLRINGLAVRPLKPVCYYWAEENALLVNTGVTQNIADLVAGFQAFFAVQDLEHPLYRALTSLEERHLDSPPPSLEKQGDALRNLHVTPSQLEEVRWRLAGDDAHWVFERLLPIICAMQNVNSAPEAQRIRDAFQQLEHEHEVKETLLKFALPIEVYDIALTAGSDHEAAERLWEEYGRDLSVWNKAVEALGAPYRPVENEEGAVNAQFGIQRDELRNITIAIVRHVLRPRPWGVPCYLELKGEYSYLPPSPEWRRLYWEVPFTATARYVRDWVADRLPETPPVLLAIFTASTLTAAQAAARRAGLDLAHDDQATEVMNRKIVNCLRYSLLLRLIAYTDKHCPGRPVPLDVEKVTADEQFYTKSVCSVCQIARLSRKDAARLVLKCFAEARLFEAFEVDPSGWKTEASWIAALHATKAQRKAARARLTKLHDQEERRKRTCRILGRDYELPPGDVFHKLREVIDEALDAEFGVHIDLMTPSPLGNAPGLRRSSGNGRSGPGYPVRSTRDQDLIGAVGEYLVYKVLCIELGSQEADAAWRSGNRRHFLGGDEGDDQLGYDFSFSKGGKHWMLEVKASRGASAWVDLSEHERTIADKVARSRQERYAVVYVANALSVPQIYRLGNPFDPRSPQKFNIQEGGVRVYFSLPK